MPACVRIPFGRGVCGVAAETKTTQLVADVHQFPGHIACDSASNSEIVVPIIKDGNVIGVLDIDSPEKIVSRSRSALFRKVCGNTPKTYVTKELVID